MDDYNDYDYEYDGYPDQEVINDIISTEDFETMVQEYFGGIPVDEITQILKERFPESFL